MVSSAWLIKGDLSRPFYAETEELMCEVTIGELYDLWERVG